MSKGSLQEKKSVTNVTLALTPPLSVTIDENHRIGLFLPKMAFSGGENF